MIWFLFFLYALALGFIFCFSFIQIILVFRFLREKKKGKESTPEIKDWPFVTIQLPLFNERYVVERLIDCIDAFDYPADKLEIQILDDSTDDTTAVIEKKLKELNSDKNFVLIRRPERVGFKAGALKYGLAIAKGEFISIFDADFLPHSNFLKKTVPYFSLNDKIGVVQTRWGHINKNYSLITQLQALGLDAHFTIEQVGRSSGGHFINFNGTGGVWRKSCIIDAGNWESDTLTEDLDLSYRAQMKGWVFKYLEEVEAPAELPATMTALKSQQFRWTKGAAETAKKHLGTFLKSDTKTSTKLHGAFHLLNSAVFVCVLLSAILSVPILIVKNEVLDLSYLFYYVSWLLVSLLSLSSFYLFSFFQFEEFNFKNLLRFLVRFPLFLSVTMGLSLHNGIAVLEGYFGKKSAFIRTPKFNIKEKKDVWSTNSYHIKKIPRITILEGLFIVYFISGLLIGLYYNDLSLMTFHIMLIFGYSFVFFYSIKHARYS